MGMKKFMRMMATGKKPSRRAVPLPRQTRVGQVILRAIKVKFTSVSQLWWAKFRGLVRGNRDRWVTPKRPTTVEETVSSEPLYRRFCEQMKINGIDLSPRFEKTP